jgi:hypothetical protein
MADERQVTEEGEGAAEEPAIPVRRAGETPRQQIRRVKHITRRHFTAEDKPARPGNRIVMEGIRGEIPVSELCRRERVHTTVYYKFSDRSHPPGVTSYAKRDVLTGSKVLCRMP